MTSIAFPPSILGRRGLDWLAMAGAAASLAVGSPSAQAKDVVITDPAYGAVANDGLDDGQALRLAFAALDPDDTLVIPAGTFHIDMPQQKIIKILDRGVTVKGAGKTATVLLVTDKSGDDDYLEFIMPMADDITIRDMTLRRDNDIDLMFFKLNSSVANFTISNCVIDGRSTYGRSDNGSGQPRWSHHNVNGIRMHVPNAPTLRNITVDNTIFTDLYYGLYVPQGASGKGVTDGFLVRSCEFEYNYASDLEFNFAGAPRSENIVVRDCKFRNSNADAGNVGWAVGFSWVVKGSIHNNEITNYNNAGIHIEDESRNVLVSGNILANTAKKYADAINITNECDNILIKDNVLDNRGNPSPPPPNYRRTWMILSTGGGPDPYPTPTNIFVRDNEIYLSKYNRSWSLQSAAGSDTGSSGNLMHMQLETNAVATSDGDAVTLIGDGNMDDDAGDLLQSNAVNDYVVYETPGSMPVGTFDVSVQVKRYPNRGRYQTSFNGTPVGGVNDQYVSSYSGSYDLQPVGPITNTTHTPRQFRFDVVGKTGASTDYKLLFDYLLLQEEPEADELEIYANQDTYVRGGSYSSSNFGDELDMMIKEDVAAEYDRHAYLQFDLSAINSTDIKAYLHLTPTAIGSEIANTSFQLWAVSDDDWDENDMWWSTRITQGNSSLAMIYGSSFSVGLTHEVDVTSAVLAQLAEDGVASFLITSTTPNGGRWVKLASSESTQPPMLVITPDD